MSDDNPQFPIATATVSYFDPNNGNALTLHVFSTDGYRVTQRYATSNGSGWVTGAFDEPGSAVSATTWNDSAGSHVRVYCTSDDGTTEYCWDPGSTAWTVGSYTNV